MRADIPDRGVYRCPSSLHLPEGYPLHDRPILSTAGTIQGELLLAIQKRLMGGILIYPFKLSINIIRRLS
jgi:hypothetical protein